MIVEKIETVDGKKYLTCQSPEGDRCIRVPFTDDVGPKIEDLKKNEQAVVYVDIEILHPTQDRIDYKIVGISAAF